MTIVFFLLNKSRSSSECEFFDLLQFICLNWMVLFIFRSLGPPHTRVHIADLVIAFGEAEKQPLLFVGPLDQFFRHHRAGDEGQRLVLSVLPVVREPARRLGGAGQLVELNQAFEKTLAIPVDWHTLLECDETALDFDTLSFLDVRIVPFLGSNLVHPFTDLLLLQLRVDDLATGFIPEGQRHKGRSFMLGAADDLFLAAYFREEGDQHGPLPHGAWLAVSGDDQDRV